MTATSTTGAPADRLTNSGDTPTTTEETTMTTTALAADVRAAIATTRDVYGSVPGTDRVLNFLEAALSAGAEVREAAEWRERALKAEAALAAGGGNIGAHTAGGTRFGPVVGNSSWSIDGQPSTVHFDQAAAKMAAESAQMAADAERMAACTATGPVDADLVLTIDTSAVDAALAKVEQLKAALACLACPQPLTDAQVRKIEDWAASTAYACAVGMPPVDVTSFLADLKNSA
ncbi:hypothetical protein SAMN05428959_1011146 [Duganella sp. CF517]|uniref:hypothetical protein n=1 Tax=Duganella sp. CF517 TaxID=1881038 RepID=UPI0008BA6369|nr:hypothetical protein [Duganella sp. CF517]SEN31669.1 hypothetical protein SAMN05428959_1011146 [Duganella sp. CF517]